MNKEFVVINDLEGRVAKAILEEACRQWCAFIDACPERRGGEGFFGFCNEIFNQKYDEYMHEVKQQMRSEGHVFAVEDEVIMEI